MKRSKFNCVPAGSSLVSLARASAIALACALLFTANSSQAQESKPLFDGTTLEGWTGDSDLWSVEDGAIVGSTENKRLSHNSFLTADGDYSDFVLRLKFKLRNHNSGVQFRSKQHDDFVVRGYQADIAESRYTGIIYEEGTGRGILADVDPDKIAEFIKADDWNEYEITAKGNHITLKLNGHVTVDYTEQDEDKGAKSGVIALQLHAGPTMRVEFKDIEIQDLASKPQD